MHSGVAGDGDRQGDAAALIGKGCEPLEAIQKLAGSGHINHLCHKVLDECSGEQLVELLAHAAARRDQVSTAGSDPQARLIVHLLRTAPLLRGWGSIDASKLLETAGDGGQRPIDVLLKHCPGRVGVVKLFLQLGPPGMREFLCCVIEGGMVEDIAECFVDMDYDYQLQGGHDSPMSETCPVDRVLTACQEFLNGGDLEQHILRGLLQLCDLVHRRAAERSIRGMTVDGGEGMIRRVISSMMALPDRHANSRQAGKNKCHSVRSEPGCSAQHAHLRGPILDAIGSDAALQSSLTQHLELHDIREALQSLRAHHDTFLPISGTRTLKYLLQTAARLVRDGGDPKLISDAGDENLVDCFMGIFERSYASSESADWKRARGSQRKIARWYRSLQQDADFAEHLLRLEQGPSAMAKVLSLQGLKVGDSSPEQLSTVAVPGAGLILVWMFSWSNPPANEDEAIDGVDADDWSRTWRKSIEWLFAGVHHGWSEAHGIEFDLETSLECSTFVAGCLKQLLITDESLEESVAVALRWRVADILKCFWSCICVRDIGSMTNGNCSRYRNLALFALTCSRYSLNSVLSLCRGVGPHEGAAQMLKCSDNFSVTHYIVNSVIGSLCLKNEVAGEYESFGAVLSSLIADVCRDHVQVLLDLPIDAICWPTACGVLFVPGGGLSSASLLVASVMSGRHDVFSAWMRGQGRAPLSKPVHGERLLQTEGFQDAYNAIRNLAKGRDMELLAKLILCCIQEEAEIFSVLLKTVDLLRGGLNLSELQHNQVLLYARTMGSLVESPYLQGANGRLPRNIAVRTFVDFFSNDSRDATLLPAVTAGPVKFLIACAEGEGKVRKNALMALAELVGAGSETIGLGDDADLWSLVDQACGDKSLVSRILAACTVCSTDGGEGVSGALLFIIALVKRCGPFKSQVMQISSSAGDVKQSKAFAELLGSALRHDSLSDEMEADPESLFDLFSCCAVALQDRLVANHFTSQGHFRGLGALMIQSPLNSMFEKEPNKALAIASPVLEAVLRWRGGCLQLADAGNVEWLKSLAKKADRQTSSILSRFAGRIERVMQS